MALLVATGLEARGGAGRGGVSDHGFEAAHGAAGEDDLASPALPQLAPRGLGPSASARTRSPPRERACSFPPAKNPISSPVGAKNGAVAPSVPAMLSARADPSRADEARWSSRDATCTRCAFRPGPEPMPARSRVPWPRSSGARSRNGARVGSRRRLGPSSARGPSPRQSSRPSPRRSTRSKPAVCLPPPQDRDRHARASLRSRCGRR